MRKNEKIMEIGFLNPLQRGSFMLVFYFKCYCFIVAAIIHSALATTTAFWFAENRNAFEFTSTIVAIHRNTNHGNKIKGRK